MQVVTWSIRPRKESSRFEPRSLECPELPPALWGWLWREPGREAVWLLAAIMSCWSWMPLDLLAPFPPPFHLPPETRGSWFLPCLHFAWGRLAPSPQTRAEMAAALARLEKPGSPVLPDSLAGHWVAAPRVRRPYWSLPGAPRLQLPSSGSGTMPCEAAPNPQRQRACSRPDGGNLPTVSSGEGEGLLLPPMHFVPFYKYIYINIYKYINTICENI